MTVRADAPAVLSWVRLDIPRRWRSLTVLALLVAIATATVLTATAGARRGATSVGRLVDRTLVATTAVLPNEAGFDWEPIASLPEVEAIARFPVSGFELEGMEGEDNVDFPWIDSSFMRTLERPVVLEGRLADPNKADEAVVTHGFTEQFGKGVGDTVVAKFMSEEQARNINTEEPEVLTGPKVPLHIVGVVRSMWISDWDGTGALVPSPALYARYGKNIIDPATGNINALIRLRNGEADLPAFRAGLAREAGRGDIDTWNLADQTRSVERSLSFEASCLLAFAIAAFAAALLLVGQAIARYTSASVEDLRTLRALGMTSRQSAAAAAAGPFAAGSLGAALGVGAALIASRWFPYGTAEFYEPAPGLHADWLVLIGGLIAVPALVLLASLVSAWVAASAVAARTSDRRSAIATGTARAGLPVPITVGTRLALETGRGRTAVPVRPALVGAVTGVLGVLAAFTFSSGVQDASRNPERFGQTYDATAFLGGSDQPYGPADQLLAAAAAVPDVTGVISGKQNVADADGGKTTVPLYTYEPVGKPMKVVITGGRLPETASEVVLGPVVADALGVGIGGNVMLSGVEPGQRSMRVSGIGFVPEGPHNDYSAGGWLTPDGYRSLFGDHYKFHLGFVSFTAGADPSTVLEAIRTKAESIGPGLGNYFDPADPPAAVKQVQRVKTLPLFLGGFLALLAVGTVGHALATAVRRRRHDIAVLRALGMTRPQTRVVVITQATVLALVGLVFGVPLGLAFGRTVWRVVADYTPLQYAPPVAFWALVLVAPVALVVCNLLAAWPGRQAARLHISHILRTE